MKCAVSAREERAISLSLPVLSAKFYSSPMGRDESRLVVALARR
jgi:hypothetical protein